MTEGRMESKFLMGIEFQFCKKKRVLKVNGDVVCLIT